jgi:hypothetical protein
MMKYTAILFLLLSTVARAQDSIQIQPSPAFGDAHIRGSYTATMAIGFINGYRSGYAVPVGFEKGNVTGFAPVFAKLEYAASNHLSLAATASYGSLYFNTLQLYTGYNGPIKRFRTNKFRVFSGGLTAYYHLGHMLNVKRLDPFVGLGINLNNIKESAFPDGDTTYIKTSHSATPYLKLGARYFVSDKVSIFADAGYDKLSMITLGFSCRFLPAKEKQVGK